MMRRAATIARTVWLEVIRRKDVYVLLILMGGLLLGMVSLNVFGLGGAVRQALDVGLLAAWVFSWVLAITVSARQLPQEEAHGTILTLLAKPVSRFEVILGKSLGGWSVVSAATAVFYLVVAGLTSARGGRPDPVAMAQGYALHAVALAIMCAVALAFSTRMHADAAASLAFVLTGASFLVAPRVPEFLVYRSGVGATLLMWLYHLLPHFDVLDMRRRIVHDFGPADWGRVAEAAAYGLAFAGLFLFLAWLGFRNRRFSRETLT
jgi:ABC-type transport system involved in multi-copper enzyme maturation permease subunit